MATKKKGTVAKSPSRKKTAKKKTSAQKTASRKKTAKKTASKKSAVRKVNSNKTTTSSIKARNRRKMIAEVAYFLSLQRCSEEGSALEDWLIAEAQVDQKLASQKD